MLASYPTEQGCCSVERAQCWELLMLMGKQIAWLTPFECNSSCLCWVPPKTIKQGPKAHDQDVTVASHSRTRGPPAADSPTFL